MDIDFDGRDSAGGARYRVWHPDDSGRVVYITVDGTLTSDEQRASAEELVRSGLETLKWRDANDSD